MEETVFDAVAVECFGRDIGIAVNDVFVVVVVVVVVVEPVNVAVAGDAVGVFDSVLRMEMIVV